MMPDAQATIKERGWIGRLKAGDRAAFDEFVAAYKGKAVSWVFHMVGNTQDAGDIVQEAFVRVFTGIGRFRGEAKFATWFYRILVNLSRDHIRRRARAGKIFIEKKYDGDEDDRDPAAEIGDESMSPGRFVLNQELGGLLDRAVAKLPEKQKAAFCMKYLDGIPAKEIAEILGCRAATVKVHIFRALCALRGTMEPYLKKT